MVGAFSGLMVGYLLGPTIPLIGGRLPFFVVLTAGINLTGFDEMLRGLAQQAFATLVVCVGIGCVCGFAVGRVQYRGIAAPTIRLPQPQAAVVTASSRFCTSCGAALSQDAYFCAACGTKKVQS